MLTGIEGLTGSFVLLWCLFWVPTRSVAYCCWGGARSGVPVCFLVASRYLAVGPWCFFGSSFSYQGYVTGAGPTVLPLGRAGVGLGGGGLHLFGCSFPLLHGCSGEFL